MGGGGGGVRSRGRRGSIRGGECLENFTKEIKHLL